MDRETRILILEDAPSDAELAVRELRRGGLDFSFRRVDSKEHFLRELREYGPDIILSDYSLPQFTGLDALELLKREEKDIPFVLCTGSLTEEVAVRCMREGAADYILKSSLTRLPSAVTKALEASESRRSKQQAIEALQKSEIEFRSIVETTNEWIWALDLEGRLTYSNPTVDRILGYSHLEILGKSVFDLVFDEDLRAFKSLVYNSFSQGSGWSQVVTRFRNHVGEIRYLESNAVPIWSSNEIIIGFRGSDRDITDRKLAEEKMLHDACHDALTGLPNRQLFMEHVRVCCERQKRLPADHFAVLLLDLDRFKVINESLGHADGDELLRIFAGRLKRSIRPGDAIARLGSDEFTILIANVSQEADVLRICERMLEEWKVPFNLDGRDVFMSAGIGIALSNAGENRPEELLRGADTAMYKAKSLGPGKYQIFKPSMHSHAVTQLQIETEIRRGIENKEFCLHYQPIVDLAGDLFGFEALVRWNHPARGLILPFDFISIAEESGLIIPLGKYVLEESCRQMKEWQTVNDASSLTVSVNISPRQFVQLDLAEQIAEILSASALAPSSLKIEITESHLMESGESALALVSRMRNLGISISLDDFGTGYSSLSYLHRLPVDYLKIDRSFVVRMTEGAEHREIVSTIINLARNLKLKTIAEGIETRDQLEELKILGCDFGQGYHFSRPLSSADAERYLCTKLVSNKSCV